MAQGYGFRGLKVRELAQELAVAVIREVAALPRPSGSAQVIGRQLVASAASIGANIAEGHGRYSKAAYRNHLSIARGSLAETESWLDLLGRIDLVSQGRLNELNSRCEGLNRMISAVMKGLERSNSAEGKRSSRGMPTRDSGNRRRTREA